MAVPSNRDIDKLCIFLELHASGIGCTQLLSHQSGTASGS